LKDEWLILFQISFAVGLYTGIYLSQNYQVLKMACIENTQTAKMLLMMGLS
jgi:hypothetical protein